VVSTWGLLEQLLVAEQVWHCCCWWLVSWLPSSKASRGPAWEMVQWRIGWQFDCWEGVIIASFCAEALISTTDRNLLTEREILLYFQNNICEESDYCKFRQVSVQKIAHCKIFQAYLLSWERLQNYITKSTVCQECSTVLCLPFCFRSCKICTVLINKCTQLYALFYSVYSDCIIVYGMVNMKFL
jgi:hypothetical protein